MKQSGQGAIEYLLIIAAAILVVAIVILAVIGALSGGQGQTDYSQYTQKESLTQLQIQQELAKKHIQITNDTIPLSGSWENEKTYFISENIIINTVGQLNFSSTTDLTVDCMGQKITTTNNTPYPIFTFGSTNLTLKNCILENFTYGFIILNPTNLTLDNINSTATTDYGGGIYNGTATVKNSNFCNKQTYELNCSSSTNLTVENSTADSYPNCINITGSFDPCP